MFKGQSISLNWRVLFKEPPKKLIFAWCFANCFSRGTLNKTPCYLIWFAINGRRVLFKILPKISFFGGVFSRSLEFKDMLWPLFLIHCQKMTQKVLEGGIWHVIVNDQIIISSDNKQYKMVFLNLLWSADQKLTKNLLWWLRKFNWSSLC